jgi:hypothetical protein
MMNPGTMLNMKKTILAALIYLTGFHPASAQKFSMEAKLGPVSESGFYDILLTPEITTHLKEDFSDIRLYDSADREISYIFRKEQAQTTHVFKSYKILENKRIKNCCTQLILQNEEKSTINNISLDIRNSAVEKKANLSGSDDGQNWYIIKDNYHLASLYNHKELSRFVLLDFPLSNYTYYKIEIQDSLNAPIQVLKAGYYDTYREEAKYLQLPDCEIKQKDSSDKNSYVEISYPSLERTDKITFEYEGPDPFFRHCRIATLTRDKKHTYFNTVFETDLISGHESVIRLPGLFTEKFYLIIENHDNIPLKFKKVTGFQLMNYLTANLSANEVYKLRFGNDSVYAGDYDLEYFRDSLPAEKRIIRPASIISLQTGKNILRENTFFKSNLWIWGAIVIIGGLLIFMAVKMVKEMGQDSK